jgi:hypothetical protein
MAASKKDLATEVTEGTEKELDSCFVSVSSVISVAYSTG